MNPLGISVIMPCHNAERWVGAALRSIAAQTRQPHEIIVVDDSSDDDSEAQIKNSGVPVTLLRVETRNAAAARNAGIDVATGDWIALLDADDVWYPNHLARATELLGPQDVAFMSNHDWIDLEGNAIPIPEGFRCKLPAPKSGLSFEDFFHIGERGFHFGHSTVLYRRDRVVEVGMFDIAQERRHDIDLWLRMIEGRTWAYDTVKGVGYREGTPGSISKDELECDYYALRALVKNVKRVDSPLLREYLSRQARRAMGIAFVDSPPEHYARIHALVCPYLPRFYKFAYAVSGRCPDLARRLIKAKRRWR